MFEHHKLCFIQISLSILSSIKHPFQTRKTQTNSAFSYEPPPCLATSFWIPNAVMKYRCIRDFSPQERWDEATNPFLSWASAESERPNRIMQCCWPGCCSKGANAATATQPCSDLGDGIEKVIALTPAEWVPLVTYGANVNVLQTSLWSGQQNYF